MPFAIFFIGDCFDASFSSRASFRWRVAPARELGKRQLSRTSRYRPASGCRVPCWRRNGSVFSARSDKQAKSCTLRPSRSTGGAMTLPSLNALLSLFPFKFLPSDSYEPFVNRVPQLVSLLLVQFFDFLFLNQMCPLVSEAIEHDLFGNGCAMPHGFGQLPVEFGSSTVGVSPTCTPAIDASGFNYVEMHAPITAFADVTSYAVNVDGVDVELPLGHRFPPLFARRRSCQVFVLDFAWSASWPPPCQFNPVNPDQSNRANRSKPEETHRSRPSRPLQAKARDRSLGCSPHRWNMDTPEDSIGRTPGSSYAQGRRLVFSAAADSVPSSRRGNNGRSDPQSFESMRDQVATNGARVHRGYSG